MRRYTLLLSMVIVIVLLVSAPSSLAQGPVSPRGFIEPPFFSARVASGELPPIDERLPEQPFVVGPGVLLQEDYMTWEDGQYGGTFNNAATFGSGFMNLAGGATLLRSPSNTTEASLPNILSDWSHSDDYTTYRLTIRRGLKWSDGVPVTTEDVRFTFDDIYNDPDVQRPMPSELYTQGNPLLPPAQLRVIDDYTFELTFSKPYGFYVAALNGWNTYYDQLIKPSHYLRQFHAKYANPDDLAKLVADNNQTSWVQLLNSKDAIKWIIGETSAFGMPTLNAWVLTEVHDTQRVFERNPYFWHVDTAGHQLPYVDRVVTNIVADNAAQTNAVLSGQVSVGNDVINALPILMQNAERSHLNVFTTGSFNNPLMLFLNHDYQYDDPNSGWQMLINDPERRFGKAIAAAMNPDDINQSVYLGLHGAPDPRYHFNDPDLANQLLDALGMDKRDDSGFRLGPDGLPLIFRITHAAWTSDFDPVAELLKQEFDAVGLHTEIERVDGNLFNQRAGANEIIASLSWNDGPSWEGGLSRDYIPTGKAPWSPMTWLYVTSGGTQGRQPPAYLQQFYDLDASRQEFPPQSAEGKALFQQLSQWFVDNYVFIPTTGANTRVNFTDARLRNVQREGAPVDIDTLVNAEGYWFADR